MAYNETLVLPPTYYFESKTCRKIINNNIDFVQQGFIKFYSKNLDYKDFVDSKKDNYEIVRKIDKYQKAYYKGKLFGIDNLPIELALKDISPGKIAFDSWEKIVLDNVKANNLNEQKFKSLIELTKEQANKSFTWEGVVKNLYKADFNNKEIIKTNLRELATSTYLKAHSDKGLRIIIGSKFTHPALTNFHSENPFKIESIKRFIQRVGLEESIRLMNNKKIIETKSKMSFTIQNLIEPINNGDLIDDKIASKFKNDFLNIKTETDNNQIISEPKEIDLVLINKKIKNRKLSAYLLLLVIALILTFYIFSFILTEHTWNYSHKLTKFIDDTESETKKDTLKALYYALIIGGVGVLAPFCWKRLNPKNVTEKRNELIELEKNKA